MRCARPYRVFASPEYVGTGCPSAKMGMKQAARQATDDRGQTPVVRTRNQLAYRFMTTVVCPLSLLSGVAALEGGQHALREVEHALDRHLRLAADGGIDVDLVAGRALERLDEVVQ